MGLTMAPSTTLVMDSIPSDKAGVGSATNDASREIGGPWNCHWRFGVKRILPT